MTAQADTRRMAKTENTGLGPQGPGSAVGEADAPILRAIDSLFAIETDDMRWLRLASAKLDRDTAMQRDLDRGSA